MVEVSQDSVSIALKISEQLDIIARSLGPYEFDFFLKLKECVIFRNSPSRNIRGVLNRGPSSTRKRAEREMKPIVPHKNFWV